MKLFAFYLPQFHEIPENNLWWGQGFTEWVNVKAARPLFGGHMQPKAPYQNNYYCLDDPSVLKEQAAIARKFGVDGFCFYHYWFNGKRLLEKPVEAFLQHGEIDIQFCLSWANEPWSRTWDGRDSEVLMPQVYGDLGDWSLHFDHLVRFFGDKRYLRVDGKPVFVLYKSSDIPRLDEMLKYWNQRAIESGFSDGIHFVETLGGKQARPISEISAAVLEFEPSLSLGRESHPGFWLGSKLKMAFHKGLYKVEYEKVVQLSCRRDKGYGKARYLGCFPNWDNTPRKKGKGVVFLGSTPELFQSYLEKQILKSTSRSLIFINAWNEWAEGAYLEPDQTFGHRYLEAVQRAKKISALALDPRESQV